MGGHSGRHSAEHRQRYWDDERNVKSLWIVVNRQQLSAVATVGSYLAVTYKVASSVTNPISTLNCRLTCPTDQTPPSLSVQSAVVCFPLVVLSHGGVAHMVERVVRDKVATC